MASGTLRRRGYALVAMARPAFMLGTAPLYAVGLAAAVRAGHEPGLPAAAVGIATVWAVQAMTHYNNEYWDVAVDAESATPGGVTGGSGVLVEGLVPRRTARLAAVASLAVAVCLVAAAVGLLGAGGPFVLVVGVAVAVGWLYSSPPVRLVGRGLGEVAVGAVTGGLVPAVGYLLQADEPATAPLRPVVPLVVLAFATAVSTALPDVAADRAGGKRTLPARLGRSRAVGVAAVALAAGWVGLALALVPVVPALGAVALAVLLAPLAGFAAAARPAARGAPDAAEHVALSAIACLGLGSVSTVAVLLAGAW